MKYANFCDTGRTSINIGDYLQFKATDYLYSLMNIPQDEIVYLGFNDLANYNGEELVFPFCYSIIDFVINGKITISKKIKPIFFSVTLSTIDKFVNLDIFFSNDYNCSYFIEHSPIGCRDEVTYNIFRKYNIPAYINGCMTAIFPKHINHYRKKTLFVDAPKSLLPYIPDFLLNNCEFSTQQYYFQNNEIADYRKIFDFVHLKYKHYAETASIAITSRLHVALPLTAIGIPVILAKDQVDGRFSFIESYIPIYCKNNYNKINWTPNVPDFFEIKNLLIKHALGRIFNNLNELELKSMEQQLTAFFKSRKVTSIYQDSHKITHNNGNRFDKYSAKYWNSNSVIEYGLWGANKNNAQYWKEYIEFKYPKAKLVAVFDSYRNDTIFGLKFQSPYEIKNFKIKIIVCSVGAANAALELFKKLDIDESHYCITSDCFISKEDI